MIPTHSGLDPREEHILTLIVYYTGLPSYVE